jgi:hypothetical protein
LAIKKKKNKTKGPYKKLFQVVVAFFFPYPLWRKNSNKKKKKKIRVKSAFPQFGYFSQFPYFFFAK